MGNNGWYTSLHTVSQVNCCSSCCSCCSCCCCFSLLLNLPFFLDAVAFVGGFVVVDDVVVVCFCDVVVVDVVVVVVFVVVYVVVLGWSEKNKEIISTSTYFTVMAIVGCS